VAEHSSATKNHLLNRGFSRSAAAVANRLSSYSPQQVADSDPQKKFRISKLVRDFTVESRIHCNIHRQRRNECAFVTNPFRMFFAGGLRPWQKP